MQVRLLISFLAAIILFAGALNTRVNTMIVAAQAPVQCDTQPPVKSQAHELPLQKCNSASYCGPSASCFNGVEANMPQWAVTGFKKHKGNTPVINNYDREYSSAIWQPPDEWLF